jgi:UDP-N-acetylmuramyl pentapeptide phosphotransferase/UDP-N-acetylglucosamine-1-phosphate transferase
VRGGGIIFYIAYLVWFILSGLHSPMIFLGLSILALVSFIDDIQSVNPKVRLVCQFAAFLIMLYEMHVFNQPWQPLLLLSVACVGAVNIYNFMDGVNGMTGGYSLVAILSLWYVNEYVTPFVDSSLLIVVLASILVFCVFNFRPHAKCFAGDVGALSIGYIVLFLILKLFLQEAKLYWMSLIIVYAVDGGMTILHRAFLGENLMMPHKKHVYQLMANELGMSHLKVSLIYMGLQALCNIWLIANPGNTTLFLQLILLSMLYMVFMRKYYHLHVE